MMTSSSLWRMKSQKEKQAYSKDNNNYQSEPEYIFLKLFIYSTQLSCCYMLSQLIFLSRESIVMNINIGKK